MNSPAENRTFRKVCIVNGFVGVAFIALSFFDQKPLSSANFYMGLAFLVIGFSLLKHIRNKESRAIHLGFLGTSPVRQSPQEQGDADNPYNPPENPKNQLDD